MHRERTVGGGAGWWTRRMVQGVIAGLLVLMVRLEPAQAGGGPENVALVVNGDSWASLAVANEYVRLRRVPGAQVVCLHDLPTFDTVSVADFREKILRPVLRALETRGVGEHIDYLVYSSDLPTAVDITADLGTNRLSPPFTQPASLTGLTYLYPLVLSTNLNYLALTINWYMRRVERPVRDTPWTPAEQQRFRVAMELFMRIKGATNAPPSAAKPETAPAAPDDPRWGEVQAALEELGRVHTNSTDVLYNLACVQALMGRTNDAMRTLERAFAAGWWDANHTERDPDLVSLRERPDFQRLVERMRKMTYTLQPSLGFRAAYQWTPAGEILPPVSQQPGLRYLLSTMLAVTSGRGNSFAEVTNYLARSVAADGTAPTGTIYFSKTEDIRTKSREWAFLTAVEALAQAGVRAEIVNTVLPQNRPDVAGAMIGVSDFSWASARSTILPGAICENFTSWNGALRGGEGQTPLTEFLRYGAAGSSGPVTEPYSVQAKFPVAFLHVHYVRGCTLAEAFYQSIPGPYQLLIVGDPLCRPWARIPQVRLEGLAAGAGVSGTVELRPKATVAAGLNIGQFEFYADGRRLGSCRPGATFSLETTALPDGYNELRVVAVTADPIATQGRLIVPFTVTNRGWRLPLRVRSPRVVWGEEVEVAAALPEAQCVTLYQDGREVAMLVGSGGVMRVDSRLLGPGRFPLRAVATVAGTSGVIRVASDPSMLEVTLPPALAAVKLPAGQELYPGLQLVAGTNQPVVVEDLKRGDWLAKAGVQAGQAFTLQGYFEVDSADVYQFQIRPGPPPDVKVDGRPLAFGGGATWSFAPVVLEPGTHHLEIKGRAVESRQLEIRFGNRGTAPLDAGRFRHAAASR